MSKNMYCVCPGCQDGTFCEEREDRLERAAFEVERLSAEHDDE